MKLIGFVVGISIVILIIVGIMYYLFHSTKQKINHLTEVEKKEQVQKNNTGSNMLSGVSNIVDDPSITCRKAENLNKTECVKWFDSLSKSGSSVPSMSMSETGQVSYDPAKPYDNEDAEKSVKYQVVNQPKFSGCMKKSDGSYRAYTEQGTYLKVTQSDCHRLMKDAGDRPYDYYTVHNSNVSSISSLQSSTSGKDSKLPLDNVLSEKDKKSSQVMIIPNNPTFSETDITKPSV